MSQSTLLVQSAKASITKRPTSAIANAKKGSKCSNNNHRPNSASSNIGNSKAKVKTKSIQLDIVLPTALPSSEESSRSRGEPLISSDTESNHSSPRDTIPSPVPLTPLPQEANFPPEAKDLTSPESLTEVTNDTLEDQNEEKQDDSSTFSEFACVQDLSQNPDHYRNSQGDASPTSCSLSYSTTPMVESLPSSPLKVEGSYQEILQVLQKLDNPESGWDMQMTSSIGDSEDTPTPQKSNKASEILSFLENLDQVDSAAVLNDDSRSNTISAATPVQRKKINELTRESPAKLADKVLKMSFVLEDKDRAIKILQNSLDHWRKSSERQNDKMSKEMDLRLQQQKEEYDAMIKRHQQFMDQLIEDKRSLSDRCEKLSNDLKTSERKHEERLKVLEQRHSDELRRLKSIHETSSKLKQEKWMDEKTRRIKEQTVRGLEPEIQRLMTRHSAEVNELENEKERCLMSQERELHARHIQHVRELRTLWEEEQHDLLQKERHLLSQRYQIQLKELRDQHGQEIERYQDLVQRERQRATDDRAHFESEAQQVRRICQERSQAEIERVKGEEEAKRRTLMKKHAAELSSIKENESVDRSDWEREYQEKVDKAWKEKEQKLAENFEKIRICDVETAKKSLRQEFTKEREQIASDYKTDLSRMKSNMEKELEDLKSEIATLRDKLSKIREENSTMEEEIIIFKAKEKQKDILISELREKIEKLELERSNVRESVKGEFVSAIETLSKERASLMSDLADTRLKVAELISEKKAMETDKRRERELELEQIHERVKLAIAKKDETIQGLRIQCDQSLEQIEHLEEALQRHVKVKVLSKNGVNKNAK